MYRNLRQQIDRGQGFSVVTLVEANEINQVQDVFLERLA